MRNLSIFLKLTHRCNLKCKYCYDAQLIKKTGQDIDINNVKKIIKLASKYFKNISLFFHGGEPLIMPVSFYEEINQYAKSLNIGVRYSMTSNGTLVNEEWIDLIKRLKLSYAVSYDGLSSDHYRCDHEIIADKIKLLLSKNINVGLVSVGNEIFLDNIINEYEHIKSLGVKHFRINELFGDGIDNEYTQKYIKSMCKLFDYWIKDQNRIEIFQFKQILKMLTGQSASGALCTNCHDHWIGMDNDGLLGLCDFGAFPRELNFGYLDDYDDFGDILYCKERLELLKQVSKRLEQCYLSGCELAGKCSGGCNAHFYREFKSLDKINGQHCEIYRKLIVYISNKFQKNK
ncbi:radical SAM protein [Clostridium sp. 'deep sea']|uniref:radical SAM protein n=1 Tax=Clostridium sp. 'deep sea' TaxID=2779445 RepID=UPI0018964F8E|nr:radical SAM protein [Clostridium sp. 'deep sea']QOR33928.1 radical SAM protein [Clostridium sp. 'deep sea']